MTIRLDIKIIVTRTSGLTEKKTEMHPSETVVYSEERNTYAPECLNDFIPEALKSAARCLGLKNISALREYDPEVSVSLFVDERECRPSIHLNAETLALLGEAGAAFDFDPYT
jgi:hypothetical protein